MLGFYAERLNAVELNGTFYRTPPPGALTKWAAETPPGFRFCFKAARGLTYSAAAFPKVAVAGQVGQRLAEMGERLGPVLLQWPPTARNPDTGLLDALLEALGLPVAVEFRKRDWLDERHREGLPRNALPAARGAWFAAEVYTVLARRGAALVVTDEEKWPMAPVEPTAGFAYYRLRRVYTDAELDRWHERLQAPEGDVYVFFKHEPEAPARARNLLTTGTDRRHPV